MKLHLHLLAAAAAALPLAAQAQNVGIGTPTPNAKAALEISATDKGLLVPRLTAAQRTAITSPPQGLMVYQTDGTASGGTQTGFWYYAGNPAAWVYLNPSAGPSGAAGGDLAGTYPNPTVATGAIGTAKLADDAVTIPKLAATGTPSASTYLRGDNTWATIAASTPNWSLNGNATSGGEFIGTTNDQDFFVKRNNAEAFRIYGNGRISIGNNTQSSASVLLGFNAGFAQTTAVYNVVIGARAGEALNNSASTFVGYGAGQSTTGGSNTLLGYYAGNKLTTGTNNVFIGNQTAYNSNLSITGSNNVVIGTSSGSGMTSNTNNILFGGNAQADAGLYDAYAIGNNTTVSQGNSLAIGNVRGTNDAVNVGIGTATPSSSLQVNGTFAVGVVNNWGGGTSGGPNGLDQGNINITNIIGGYYGLNPGVNTNYYLLPNPTACPGRIYYLRNNSTGTSAFLLTTGGSIYGASSTSAVSSSTGYELRPNAASKTVIAISDGTNWTVGYLN